MELIFDNLIAIKLHIWFLSFDWSCEDEKNKIRSNFKKDSTGEELFEMAIKIKIKWEKDMTIFQLNKIFVGNKVDLNSQNKFTWYPWIKGHLVLEFGILKPLTDKTPSSSYIP